MELRRLVMLHKLALHGVYEARDGRILRDLSINELEIEFNSFQQERTDTIK
ncbi:hypothetical protein [Sutcliffiella rhizosphaerae]|uniref:Fur-regulated basic protein FbpA n=1 Tax=Sutcliffiella rhizosphaerae TaxID=2880967 RepID=A0ABN8AB07_9BACI|nr:hypothetical protein [Sutcliffiella rhizosphaerae]CAG9621096.1 hypothetical protein BACCIP111883_01868 [Sutcliffiella rhizosphaerae]